MRICPQCKNKITRPGTKFCPECGLALAKHTPNRGFDKDESVTVDLRKETDSPPVPAGTDTGDAATGPANQNSGRAKRIWLPPLVYAVAMLVMGVAIWLLGYLNGYIGDNQPPQVNITSPARDQTLTIDSTGFVRESIAVTASDNKRVSQIDLWLNGALVKSTKRSTRLTYDWESTKAGKYNFYAVAQDPYGNINQSKPLVIVVEDETVAVAPVTKPKPENVADTEKEIITDLVTNWVETLHINTLDQHMNYYADHLEIYYTIPDFSKDDVYRDKAQTMSKYDVMDTTISHMQIDFEDPTTAQVTFNKAWDARGRETFSGEVLQRLKLIKSEDQWLIVGERELQIYWVIKNGKKIV